MSKFKEKVLSEISFAMVDDAPDLQKLYDKVAAIDEHPQLNENQQIVLEFLKNEYNGPIMINPMEVIFALHDELVNGSKIDIVEAYVELSDEDEIQVLQVFSQWMLEKEEAE